MDKFFSFFMHMPFGVLFLLFCVLYLIANSVSYIYISINMKLINGILYGSEDYSTLPLSRFDFFVIGSLPYSKIREIFTVRYGWKFDKRKLYPHNYFYELNEVKLKKLLNEVPLLFTLQYISMFIGIVWIVFGVLFGIFEYKK